MRQYSTIRGTPYIPSLKVRSGEAIESRPDVVPIHILCHNTLTRAMIAWVNAALATLASSISVDNHAGLVAIFFIALSCDIGVPFPFVLDTIVFFTTYEVGALSWQVLLVLVMLLGGSMMGTSILYWISRLLGPRFVAWLGRRSKFLQRGLERFQNRLDKWKIPVIVAARLTPGLMQVSTVAAGTMRVSYSQMVLCIIFSFIAYDGTLVALGTIARLGLRDVGPQYSAWIVIGFVGIMTAIFVAVHLIRRRLSRAKTVTKVRQV
jgi:membrane protein DedA with SNARE-associated domain